MNIYLVSAATSTLIAVSYLVFGLLVLPALPRDQLRRNLLLFGVAILLIDSIRRALWAGLILLQAVALDEDQPTMVAAWIIVALSLPHALLAIAAAFWGLFYLRPRRILRDSEYDERDQVADARESDADRRETKADARQGSADWREGVADHREGEADRRERDADKRECEE